MKHIFASLLDVAKVAIAVVVLGFGASTLSAQSTWIPAPANPPANNAPAPINVSDLPQRKFGPLLLGITAFPDPPYSSLDVLGIASTTSFFSDFLVVSKGVTFAAGSPMKRLLFNASGLSLIDGTQGAGKVLTSNAGGLASWQALPTPTAGTRIIAGTGISVSPSSGVGDVTVSTTGSGLQIIGPLTDPSGTGAAHQASFTLSAASEVIVTAYAQLSSDAGGPGYVKLLIDGTLVRTNYYGEECGRYCGGGTASVVLSARQTLAAGSHLIKVESPGSRPSIYATPDGGGVQFYVYVLNGGGGSGTTSSGTTSGGTGTTGSGGVSSIVAGTGVTVSPASGTGSVTINAASAPGNVCGAAVRKGTMTNFNTVSSATDSWGCAVDPSGSNFNGGSDTNDAYRRTLLNNGTCTGSRKVVVDALERSFICVKEGALGDAPGAWCGSYNYSRVGGGSRFLTNVAMCKGSSASCPTGYSELPYVSQGVGTPANPETGKLTCVKD